MSLSVRLYQRLCLSGTWSWKKAIPIALGCLLLTSLSVSANADTISFTDTQTAKETYSINTGSGAFTITFPPTFLQLSQFDPSLGVLQGVTFDFSGSTYVDIAKVDDEAATGSAPVSVQVRGLTWNTSVNASIGSTTTLDATANGFDDFGLVCGFCTVVSPGLQATRSANGTLPLSANLNNLNLNDFLGIGNFALSVSGETMPGGMLPPGVTGYTLNPQGENQLFIDAELDPKIVAKVTYTYTAAQVPEPGTLTLCLAGMAMVAVSGVRKRLRKRSKA